MSKPYDATSKDLIETDPAGWVTFLGGNAPASAVSLVDADVSTVTTDADKVIRVDAVAPWLLHLDIQTGWQNDLDRRLLRYNALLHYRHAIPVASVLVILRSSASVTSLSGVMPVRPPVGANWDFRYEVIRVWERDANDFLTAPLGLVPLAPLARVRANDLPSVVAGMRQRIDAQPDRSLAAKLWAATYVLMGLRFDQASVETVLSGVMQMEESVTYQAILRRGEQAGLQQGLQRGSTQGMTKLLLRQGHKRFGNPTAAQEARIVAITDSAKLEQLSDKILEVNTWDELLAGV
jgi:predicted transposase YdaD